jgi:hypothetical protein
VPIGGGTPGTGGQSDSGSDAGVDAGFDAGTEACDAGCLGLGQTCSPDVIPNGGCMTGLFCMLNLINDTSYTCQSNNGDF